MFAKPGFSPLLIGGGGSGLTRTYQGNNPLDLSHSVNSSTFNFGDEDAGRFMVCGVGIRHSGAGLDVSALTIGGVSATLLKKVANGSGSFTVFAGLYGAVVPTGASGTVAATFTGNVSQSIACLWSTLGLNSTTPTDDASDNPANDREIQLPVTADDGGVSFAMSTWRDGKISDISWSDINRDFYVEVGSQRFSAASQQNLPAGARSIVATSDAFSLDSIAGVAITMR